MPIRWSSEYSVGLDEIDEQHKSLISIINKLEMVTLINPETAGYNNQLMKILEELINYTVLHFATEELMMKMFDYQDFVEHKKGHDDFVNLVLDKKTELEKLLKDDAGSKIQNNIKALQVGKGAKEIYDFLQKWLLTHIMKTDMKYTSFFIKIQDKAKKSGGWKSLFGF